jgi:hypothetical protein
MFGDFDDYKFSNNIFDGMVVVDFLPMRYVIDDIGRFVSIA